MQEELEDRLNKLVDFLKNNTSGLFGRWNPLRRGIYFWDTTIAKVFTFNEKETIALTQGRLDIAKTDKTSGNKHIDRFFAQYREVYLPVTQSKSIELIIDSKPDDIIDVPTGDGRLTLAYINIIRSESRRSIPLICIEQNEESLIAAKRIKPPNSQYFLGKIVKGGTIEGLVPHLDTSLKTYKDGILERGKRYALIAMFACNQLSDYIGEFIVKNDIDSFVIYRCCYGGLAKREYFTDINAALPINQKVCSILSKKDQHKNQSDTHLAALYAWLFKGDKAFTNRRMKRSNVIIADQTRHLISLDLAVYLKRHGYEVRIERLFDLEGKGFDKYIVYGRKSNR